MELFIYLGAPALMGVLVAEFWLVVRLDRKPRPGQAVEAVPERPEPNGAVADEPVPPALEREGNRPQPEEGEDLIVTHESALGLISPEIWHHFVFPWPLTNPDTASDPGSPRDRHPST